MKWTVTWGGIQEIYIYEHIALQCFYMVNKQINADCMDVVVQWKVKFLPSINAFSKWKIAFVQNIPELVQALGQS